LVLPAAVPAGRAGVHGADAGGDRASPDVV